jgi:hypothetical protein
VMGKKGLKKKNKEDLSCVPLLFSLREDRRTFLFLIFGDKSFRKTRGLQIMKTICIFTNNLRLTTEFSHMYFAI